MPDVMRVCGAFDLFISRKNRLIDFALFNDCEIKKLCLDLRQSGTSPELHAFFHKKVSDAYSTRLS